MIAPSSRSFTRDAVRLINVRRLLLPAMVALALCTLAAFIGGFWLGQLGRIAGAEVQAQLPQALSEQENFALNRVGELVGQLRSLEADAEVLRQMLDEHVHLSQQVSSLDPSLAPQLLPATAKGGRGGVLLPARGCTDEIEQQALNLEILNSSHSAARCLRASLDQLLERVAAGNAQLMAIPSLRPVEGARLGSSFGNRVDPFNKHLAFHSGLDFSIASGADVVAAAGGRVRFAGSKGGYGKLVELDHGNGLRTRYAHLSSFQVKAGDLVTPGQRLGAVGSTGRSTGPHLHFEVLHKGRFVDPQRFLALSDLPHDEDGLAHD